MTKFLFLFAALFSITYEVASTLENKASGVTQSKAYSKQIQFLDETPNFHYKVDTDSIKQNVQGTLKRYKIPDDGTDFGQGQYGNYSFTDPNGKLHMVVFKADENGVLFYIY